MSEDKSDLNPDVIFERRRFVRIDGTFVVGYTDISIGQSKSDISQTRNISIGGILFTTDRTFAPGTILRLRLRVPGSPDYINVRIHVVDSKPRLKDTLFETRAKFIGISEEDKDYIKRIIEYNLQKGKEG